MKKSTKVLLGAGVVLSAAGIGYAVHRSRKKDSSRYSPDASILRSPGTSSSAYRSPGASSSTTSILTAPSAGIITIEPKGWLAAVVWHGGLCTQFSIEYMTSKKFGDHWHLLPQLNADPKQSPQEPDLQWGTSTLMVNRFAEWPSPVFPRCSPMFTAAMADEINAGGSAHDWTNALGVGASAAGFNLWPSYTKERAYLVSAYNAEQFNNLYAVLSDGTFLSKDHYNKLPFLPVYPAKRVVEWVSWASDSNHLMHNKGLELTATSILAKAGPGAMNRPLKVPEYFRQSKARLYDWCLRISKWYATAQWLVWAGEMMRLHCHKLRNTGAPSWWRTHCAAWAIGVPSLAQQKSRKVFSDDTANSNEAIETKLTADETYEILQLIMGYTPVPGTEGCTGEQIASTGNKHLCDMPNSLGSLLPPIELVAEADSDGYPNHWWSSWSVSYWRNRRSTFNWAVNVVMPIVNAIGSIGGGAASGAIKVAMSTVTSITQQIVYRVATFALQAAFRLSRGDVPLNAGDVIGLVGDAVSLSGLTDDLSLKGLPADTWNSIQTFGASIVPVSGTDWPQIKSKLEWVQSNLHNIKNFDKWPYIDQGFGGLGMSGKVRDAALDTLGKTNLAT